ncbi:MAG: acetylglutamate kinase [Desulfovibrio sp.]|nr:acetylglutamate kinase [Desulfovibrio sp.]
MQSIAVIKYGGHAMDHPELAASFAKDMGALAKHHTQCVLVHGGGPQIASLLARLGIESHFVNGLRVTDAQTLEAVEMVLSGTVNKAVCANLLKIGVQAVGLSGRDANMLVAKQADPSLGLVGTITQVHCEILVHLLQAGFVPVVAPVANDEHCQPLNVNADTAAGAVAGALRAQHFILISDVPGVLDQNGKRFDTLDFAAIEELKQSGVITGGMIPKVQACVAAIQAGASRAIILDGRTPNSLRDALINDTISGTLITA